MLSHLIRLHRTFITPDRVIIHGITVGRGGMQIHKLFYSVVGTSDLPNITSLTTCCVTQSESLAEQLTALDLYLTAFIEDQVWANCVITLNASCLAACPALVRAIPQRNTVMLRHDISVTFLPHDIKGIFDTVINVY